MKMIFAVLASLTLSSLAMAGIKNQQVAAGSQAIIRQILDQKLINDAAVNDKLTMALEGSNGGDPVEIKSMYCEPGLGSLYCVIRFEQLTAFDIDVRLYQGHVISASVR